MQMFYANQLSFKQTNNPKTETQAQLEAMKCPVAGSVSDYER